VSTSKFPKSASLEPQAIHFQYQEAYSALPDPYETLMLTGDQTRFVRADVEASWRLYDPLLKSTLRIRGYPARTWGPMESEDLLERDQRQWRNTDE
jgi:glucose-6-phosphate 1-dehydrogenase